MEAWLAQINWQQHVTQGWAWAKSQSSAGLAFLAALPRDCWSASMHAGLVCSGNVPEYFNIPGFPPLSLSWGWMLVGILIGVTTTLLVLSLTGNLRREPRVAALPRLPQVTHNTGAQARQDLLNYISTGRQALQEVAAASHVSEMDLLRTAYGLQDAAPQVAGSPAPGRRILM